MAKQKKDEAKKNIEEENNKESIKKTEWEDKYKRALADYQNLLRQSAKEKEDFVRYANEQLIMELVPVFDNLKAALSHGKKAEDANDWIKGLNYVIEQFRQVLKENGVEEIEAVGKIFDHNTMDALKNKETEDKEKDGVVAEQAGCGYKLNEKVIIPAKVIVYKYNK
jgi:molecular chaperone GrpE